jgi:hypothetical protein
VAFAGERHDAAALGGLPIVFKPERPCVALVFSCTVDA